MSEQYIYLVCEGGWEDHDVNLVTFDLEYAEHHCRLLAEIKVDQLNLRYTKRGKLFRQAIVDPAEICDKTIYAIHIVESKLYAGYYYSVEKHKVEDRSGRG